MADKQARAVLAKFMQQQKLIDMNTKLSDLMELTRSSGIDEVAGYVVAWEKYVTIIASDALKADPVSR